MDGPDSLEAKLRAAWPPETWQDVTVVLAVSGGADSVAMLRATAALKLAGSGRLVVGHFHHGLRPAADDDEMFVEQLCRELGISCEVGRADVAATAQTVGDGVESAARQARYKFLTDLAEQHGARLVATAHTADDQAETILHHILRGTGLAGLAGMPRCRPLSPALSLVRPLLSIHRREVLDYLKKIGQPYRHDESNDERQFTRNRIRHELIPLLTEQYNADAVNAILRLGQLADEAQAIIARAVERQFAASIQLMQESAIVDCNALGETPPHLVREILIEVWRRMRWPLQSMGFDQWQLLASMVEGEPMEKNTFPGAVLAQKKDGRLTLTRH